MISLQRFTALYKVIDTLRNILIIFIFSFIIFAGAWAIFLRYTPDLKTLPWIDEVLRYLNIWLVFLGASVAVKQDSHLSVDFFLRILFPANIATAIKKITIAAILTCLGILLYASTRKVLGSLNVVIQAAPVSIALFYLAIPIGCLFLILDYALILLYGEHPFTAHHSAEAEE